MKRFAIFTALAAGMALAQAPAPPAQPASPGDAFGHRAGVRHRWLQELNLTDAQKEQAKSIFEQAKQSAQPVRQQLKQNREALATAVKANDTAQITQLSQAAGNLRGQLIVVRAQAKAKFYDTLTPDQQAKASQIHERIRQRMRQQRGNAGPGAGV